MHVCNMYVVGIWYFLNYYSCFCPLVPACGGWLVVGRLVGLLCAGICACVCTCIKASWSTELCLSSFRRTLWKRRMGSWIHALHCAIHGVACLIHSHVMFFELWLNFGVPMIIMYQKEILMHVCSCKQGGVGMEERARKKEQKWTLPFVFLDFELEKI